MLTSQANVANGRCARLVSLKAPSKLQDGWLPLTRFRTGRTDRLLLTGRGITLRGAVRIENLAFEPGIEGNLERSRRW